MRRSARYRLWGGWRWSPMAAAKASNPKFYRSIVRRCVSFPLVLVAGFCIVLRLQRSSCSWLGFLQRALERHFLRQFAARPSSENGNGSDACGGRMVLDENDSPLLGLPLAPHRLLCVENTTAAPSSATAQTIAAMAEGT